MGVTNVPLILLSAVLAVTCWLWRRCRSRTVGGDAGSKLPPGPPDWPIVGNLLQITLRRQHFIHTVNDLRNRYGPIFKLRMGQRTIVVVSSAELIHEALVKRGALFANRPPEGPVRRLFSSDKCTINSAHYGPLWRTLRRNFAAEIMSAPRIKRCSSVRYWAIECHLLRLRHEFRRTGAVNVMANCRLTITSLLVCMCFGARIPVSHVQDIMDVLREVMIMTVPTLPDFFPLLSLLFKMRLMAARRVRRKQLDCLMPLVAARREFVQRGTQTVVAAAQMEIVTPAGGAYVDSLFELDMPEERQRLSDEEIVTLCCEVISGGTDTSAAALEWAMMHLVLQPKEQHRLYDEVVATAGQTGQIKEAHLEAMPYLQAVVKETLRLHPPTHFLLSHAVTEVTELGGYRIPADAVVEFYTAWVPRDPEAWSDPGAWRPDRFLEGGEGANTDIITGTPRALRMLPFGAGRRVCPGASLGTLHLQLVIAAMVRDFRWMPVAGDTPPDPAEAFAFTVVMKNSLRAAILERKVGDY